MGRDDRRVDRAQEPPAALRRGAARVRHVVVRRRPGAGRPSRLMFETVVVPIDGSPLSHLALPVAVRLAAAGHAGLRLVAVARDDNELAMRRDNLQEASRSVPATSTADLDVVLD